MCSRLLRKVWSESIMAGFVFQVVFSHCVKNGLLEATLIKPWNGCYGPELEEG